ncbi:unnamed protein product [Caenorhabditis angaria]|uniref:Moesin/ezrin/radixin homolog 1 n=1 Tax=Caenorhabditis angaria TaxID=860376 RepID=A0A9P1J5V9_9PELO|nr:unnamed protein product [Caenorhabditis angaria]
MTNIPRGVGAPPPPGMNSTKRGRLVCIKVRMLDDTVAVFHLGHKAIGQTLLDEVCRHLNLLECDYFGLAFIDINGNHCWLDREKTILRQITNGSTDAKFYFIVKFYTPNPIDLEEEYTRYLFTLQIKRDLALGELHCSDSTAALLSAYSVQSECGDFSSDDYPDATYLSHSRFVPNQTLEFQKKVMDNHRNFIGMSPGESDLAMLEVARRCDFYSVKLHVAKDVDGNDAALSVMHLGIKVFRQLQLDTTFSWARIRKLSFKRKKLLVKLHPDSYQYLKETVEFVFDTRDECKNFWKKCVEHHAFFRCVQSEEPRKETRFFISKGSSFRYHGRTQKQLIDYVREHHKRREPFTRPLRSATTRKGGYSSSYGIVTERSSVKQNHNGSVYDDRTDPYKSRQQPQQQHSSMPHIAHYSSYQADPSFSGTLDARVGGHSTTTTTSTNHSVPHHHQRLRQIKRSDRCTSDVESVERPSRNSHSHSHHYHCSSNSNNNNNKSVAVPSCNQQPDLSVSLPNVLSDDLQIVCKEIQLENQEPPKSVSGDNFQDRRTSKDYDNVSEGSYQLSDHERSTRSEVGIGSKHAAATIFNSTFVAKPNRPIVKRVVAQSKSTPNSTDDEGNELKSPSDYHTFRYKEYPFVKNANIVPIEIDGPNVDLTERRSTTVSTTSKVLTSSGAVLVKPKVISTEDGSSSRGSPESGTYGALGPIPGRVMTKENVIITPENSKRPKPAVPAKPVDIIKTERASSHPLVHMVEQQPFSRAPLEFEERKSSLSRPALISVQSEDNPDIQKCHLFNSDIPYTLTMRNVESTQSLPFSSFKTVDTIKQQSQPQAYESNSLKRVSKSPEFKRRKSLDLVPRKRLPSPGNFSAQDHTISPTTPDSDVLEYLLRRKSLLTSDKQTLVTKTRRTDPRRQTQPVRFDLPPSPCSPTAGGSTPFISILNDDVFDECVSESRSLHEDMDRLDKTTPHTQSISSFTSNKSRRDSEDSDIMPPPPAELRGGPPVPPPRPVPPTPPPKSLAAAVRVAEMKAKQAGKLVFSGKIIDDKLINNDSPPFIDESPKNNEPIYQQINKKKDVIVGINSTFSSETICTSEPIKASKKKSNRMTRSTTDTTELTRADSSDSGGVSLGEPGYSGNASPIIKNSQSLISVGTSHSRDIETKLETENVEMLSLPTYRDDYFITRSDFAKEQAQLGNVIKEFYWKEVVFTKDLNLIMETFFETIKENVLQCLYLKEMFGSLNELRPIQKSFMETLKETMNGKEELMSSTFSPVLLATVHNLIPIYNSLVLNYPFYVSALDQLIISKPEFRAIITKFEASKQCYIPINWLLIKILSRIINWQPVLARLIEIQLSEGVAETEITSVRVAMDKINEYAKKSKASRNQLEEYVSLLQLEKDIGLVGKLSNPIRKVLRFGYVLRYARRAPCNRVMILCSDRILFGHRGVNLDGNFFTVHAELKLKGLMVEEGDTYKVMDNNENVITLHNADISIVISAPDRASWIEDITEAIKEAARSKSDLPSLVMEKKEECDIDMVKALIPEESPMSKLSPLQICWYRKCSFGKKDTYKMVTNTMCGYLKRKLRNSSGWQDLWVVLCCNTLFFYRNHEEKEPLAHLSLIDYGIGLPNVHDNINHENCFKLFYGSHQYFFKADTYYFFERWVDSIFQAAISHNSLDVVTALALHI